MLVQSLWFGKDHGVLISSLLLPDCLPQADGDDVALVVVLGRPVVEEPPQQFGDAGLVVSAETLELVNFVEVGAFSAVNGQFICWLHGLQKLLSRVEVGSG